MSRISEGKLQNVAFVDFTHLLNDYGFTVARISGSHHVFVRESLMEILTLQEVKGKAKPYQIRQFLKLVERYNLTPEERG